MGFIGGAAVLALSFAACLTDIKSRKIPNLIPLTGFILLALMTVTGLFALDSSAMGFLFSGGVFLTLYIFGVVGGGDVKLMAVLGGFAGQNGMLFLIEFVFICSLFAAAFGLVVVILSGRFKDLVGEGFGTLKSIWQFFRAGGEKTMDAGAATGFAVEGGESQGKIETPFAPGIFAASLYLLVFSHWAVIGV